MTEEKKVASMATVKRIIRKRIKAHPELESEGINIYPMMDMMTILLVFMVMQVATSSATVVTKSDELEIPYSTSTEEMVEAMPVQISKSNLVVDGMEVCTLRNGYVDSGDKQGGSKGFKITPLARKLKTLVEVRKEIARRNPSKPFKGDVTIIADKHTPYRTLSEVIYTLGKYEFRNIKFLADKSARVKKKKK